MSREEPPHWRQVASEAATQWNLVLRGLCFLMVAGGKDAKTMDNMDGITWEPARTCWTAQGTLLHVVWQPGWEGSLGEHGYMCMHG